MSGTLKINKCHTLPETLEANCIYFVKGETDTDVIIYVTGQNSQVLRHTITRTEIFELLEENGTGIIRVDILPDPSEALAGRLYCLNGVNTPCWCTGSEWLDLSKSTGVIIDPETGLPIPGTVTAMANKMYRNESVFGIKIL